jgi:transcriptional regulator with XRE-family HTH domain
MEIKIDVTYKNERLKALREDRGLSQSQLAAAADISTRVLQNYEQGVRDLNGAKLVTLLKLCNALECKLADIVTDEETLEQLGSYDNR